MMLSAVKHMVALNRQGTATLGPALPGERWLGAWLGVGGVMVFAPLIEGGTTHLPFMILRLVLLCVACTWVLRSLRSSELSIPRSPLWWPAAVFVGWSGLSLLWSSYVQVSLQWFVSILLFTVLLGAVLHSARSRLCLRGFVRLILAMGALEGAIGLVQFMWGGESRAKGTFFNPNFFATYEAVSCVLALGLLSSTTRADLRRGETLFLALTAGISGTAIILAQSRGAAVAFLAAVLLVGLYRYGTRAVVLLVVLVVSGLVIPNPLKQRAMETSVNDPYAYTRLEMWTSSLQRIVDHPFGTGLGTYKYTSFQYRFPLEQDIIRYGKRAESAHNEYLQIASELGIGGLGLFLLCVGVWLREGKRLLSRPLSEWDKGAALGLIGAAVAILVHASVDSVFHEPALVLLLILLGGLVLALTQESGIPEQSEGVHSIPCSPAIVVLMLCLVVPMTCIVIQPAAVWHISQKGQAALATGDTHGAFDWYRRALWINPGMTANHDVMAQLSLAQFTESRDPHWLTQAIDEWAIAMALNPLDGRFPFRIGTAYLLLSQQPVVASYRDSVVSKARAAFEKAITVDPFSPFSYLELGEMLRQQGDNAAAQTLLSRAIAYEPNFLPARSMLAELAVEMGQVESAASQQTLIRGIQLKYRDRTLSPLEQQYLALQSKSVQ